MGEERENKSSFMDLGGRIPGNVEESMLFSGLCSFSLGIIPTSYLPSFKAMITGEDVESGDSRFRCGKATYDINAGTRLQQSSWSWLKLDLTHLISCSCYLAPAPGSDRDAPIFGLLDWGTWKSNSKPSSPFMSRPCLSFLLGRPYFLNFKLKVRLVWQSSSKWHRILMSHLASKCQNCKTALF